MQAELKIKEILEKRSSTEMKVEEVTQIMSWDKKKLTEAILKYGTSNSDARKSIIEEFWGKGSNNGKRGRD